MSDSDLAYAGASSPQCERCRFPIDPWVVRLGGLFDLDGPLTDPDAGAG